MKRGRGAKDTRYGEEAAQHGDALRPEDLRVALCDRVDAREGGCLDVRGGGGEDEVDELPDTCLDEGGQGADEREDPGGLQLDDGDGGRQQGREGLNDGRRDAVPLGEPARAFGRREEHRERDLADEVEDPLGRT